MSMVLYGDFTDPDCYFASRRADALAAAGVPVDFRAVESRPGLSVIASRMSVAAQDALTARFATLSGLLRPGEELPWTMPAIVPRSEAAVAALAEAYDSPVASDVRALLFDLYWRDGADVGSPNVLRVPLAGPFLRAGSGVDPVRRFGYAVSVDRGPISTSAYRRIREWRAEWQQLGAPNLPVLLVDGATLHGVDAVRRLGKQIGYVDASPDPALSDPPDPRRYPHLDVRPAPGWVSQIGGRWRTAYRPSGVG